LARPVLGHALLVLGVGSLHPKARRAMQLTWGPVEEAQFKILCLGVGLAHRKLPKRVVLSPLAHNRWQYERLIAGYRTSGLESFAPEHENLN
jgi:uncharacterized protein (DUF2236 family)